MGQYSWPPITTTSASTGSTGATAPTSATEIGVIDGSGNLQGVTQGQAAMAASLPVVIASNQTAIPASQSGTWNVNNVSGTVSLPTGASTSALQTSGNTSLTTIATNTTTANTSLSTIATNTPALGQTTKSGSSPVTIASDQGALSTQTADATASGSITTQNLNPNSGAATASSTVAITSLAGQITWSVQVTGTYTGALTPQVTIDGSNWIALSATAITNVNTNAQAATIASAAVGIFEISAPPCAQLRITALGSMTGTAVVTMRASIATGRVGLDSPIPAGTAIIGALSANQSANVAQVNGVTPLMGNGVTGTGSQRVTIASDNTAFSVNAVQSGTWTVQPGNTANTTAWLVSQEKAATATLTNVAGSATTVSLLALNTGRKQATFFNDSTAILYLKFGTTASTTSYTVQIPANGYYELPGVRVYTGAIDGIWSAANGNVRITELS